MVVNRFCIAALLLIYLGSVWCFSRFTLPKVGKKVSLFRATNADFENAQEYLEHLETQARLPQGFEVGATTFTFQPFEVANKDLLMNLTIIKTDVPTDSFAAMFTSNKFPGGPVLVGKERMKSSPYIQAVVINNKISNVCPGGLGDGGAGDSDAVCEAVSGALQLPSKDYVFPSSTGIIGWRLPVDAIKANIASVVKSFQSQSFLPGAKGITTTDRYPKLRSYTSSSGSWTISCIAKGAGMIGGCDTCKPCERAEALM
jgi:glutamate N-acetyltransferase/amino-acid N-acetyltransferase